MARYRCHRSHAAAPLTAHGIIQRYIEMFRPALLVLVLMSTPAFAAEWFVSTTGNDSNNGSQSSPWRSVGHALNASSVSPGDTITVRGPAGSNTYNECNVRMRKRVVLRSYAGERAHIHCQITSSETNALTIYPAASGSRVTGLEISGGRYYGIKFETEWEQGHNESGRGASNIIVEDTWVHDTGRDAIKITPKSDHITIRGSEIWNSGRSYPAGTDPESMNAEGIDNVNGSYMVVEDNYIHDTATTGVYFKGGARGVIVQRNYIENTGAAGILVGFDTSPQFFDRTANPQWYEAIDGIVRNNVIRKARYSGIGMYAAKNPVVANNTIIDSASRFHAAIYFGVTFQSWDSQAGRPASVNPLIRNNLIIQPANRACLDIRHSNELGGLSGLDGSPNMNFNAYHNSGCTFRDTRPGSSSSALQLAQWKAHSSQEGNSISASLSVDSTGHLPAGSAAIERGTGLAQVTDDIDGQQRFAPYDIGADEVKNDDELEDVFTNGFE